MPESQDPEQAALVSEPEAEKTNEAIVSDMIRISDAIAQGATSFMWQEFCVGLLRRGQQHSCGRNSV